MRCIDARINQLTKEKVIAQPTVCIASRGYNINEMYLCIIQHIRFLAC